MSDNVFVNRDRSKVVPAGSVEAKWQMRRSEAVKLGLLDTEEKPRQARRVSTATSNGTPQRRRTKKSE